MKNFKFSLLAAFCLLAFSACTQNTPKDYLHETTAERDARMQWWRDARFGLFIHWGLYAIPAGEWNGKTDYAEWIRDQAQIPIETYDQFVKQFNPTKFNADEWVKMAKNAGMKYIVITSKHHDGFCLFDSKYTDYDVMSTPFHRDILKELSEACRANGIQMCWYHSIMDWHEPDYLPRRPWETNRSTEGADFNRYIQHLKNQLRELVTNYGRIGVLWFDGEWESTWNNAYGSDLYKYVRGLQPSIIINNRVSVGRSGMEGMTKGDEFAGDFGTPEQTIPGTGLPGVDWETCMTMNDHWGFNINDQNFKSSQDLIQKLADIASKGGNFLLNIGPTSEGLFPQPSIDRLKDIGSWMKLNGESIYATHASPFKFLPWGRCTQKSIDKGTRLYLHVFQWPQDGKLVVPGIFNDVLQAYLLSDSNKGALNTHHQEDAVVIDVPAAAPDAINSVVVLDIAGQPDISDPPEISAENEIFIDTNEVTISSNRRNIEMKYTVDGKIPDMDSPTVQGPVLLKETATVSARCFRNGKPVSGTAQVLFTKVKPQPAVELKNTTPGLNYRLFKGDWDVLPDFSKLKPTKEGTAAVFQIISGAPADLYGIDYNGYIQVPQSGIYTFYTESDDGSRLWIDHRILIDNDGLHSMIEKPAVVALAAGFHPIRVSFFEKTGGEGLAVRFKGPGIEKKEIPAEVLFH
jgi:alpha-L-fucosidase